MTRASRAFGSLLGVLLMSVIAGILTTLAITPVIAVAGTATSTAIEIYEDLPDYLAPSQLAQPSTLYAKTSGGDRQEIATFYAQNREPVAWGEISQFVKDSAVAEEDPRFYAHGGVDVLAAGRAVVQNLAGQNLSGASTITMQYVRNVLVQKAEAISDPEESAAAYRDAMRQDMDRKLQEMRYAISIEKEYSKDQILLGYLNIALFGKRVYGIESAAQYYYGKNASDVTLGEAASLVAIVNNPARLHLADPENVDRNQDRRDRILSSMLEHGKITQDQYETAVAAPVEPDITPRTAGCSVAQERDLGHFCNYVQQYILNDSQFGETRDERYFNFVRGGYDIETTVDLQMQRAGAGAMRETVPATLEGIDVGGASVSLEVGTGKVRAMVQNRPFTAVAGGPGSTGINFNADSEYGGSQGFQIGSTFKPVTLAQWLRTGHSLSDRVNVNGRTVQEESFAASCMPGGVYGSGAFTFTNDNTGTTGRQTVLTALEQSVNGGFVSMQQQMDLCDTFEVAERLGLHRASDQRNEALPTYGTRELTMVPSNVYGGIDEISPITLASAYSAFAGRGTVCTPVPIERITGPDGEEIPFSDSTCSQAIAPEIAAGVAHGLQHAITDGVARHARSNLGVPHLAKTGTTDRGVDNWTVGASSEVATATWVGNVTGKVSTFGFGDLARSDQTIWPAIMDVADRKYGGAEFPDPPGDLT